MINTQRLWISPASQSHGSPVTCFLARIKRRTELWSDGVIVVGVVLLLIIVALASKSLITLFKRLAVVNTHLQVPVDNSEAMKVRESFHYRSNVETCCIVIKISSKLIKITSNVTLQQSLIMAAIFNLNSKHTNKSIFLRVLSSLELSQWLQYYQFSVVSKVKSTSSLESSQCLH